MLVGLFAGEAAFITGQLEERIIVQKAMDVLNRIFGNNCPPEVFNLGIGICKEEIILERCCGKVELGDGII